MKKLMTVLMLLIGGVSFGQVAFGDVVGTIIHAKTGDAIWDARVFILDNDKVYRTKSDPDGRFKISAIPSGTYQVLVSKNGDTLKANWVEVKSEAIADCGEIKYSNNILDLPDIIFTLDDGRVKIEKGFLPLPRLTAEEIEKSPLKFNINQMVSSMTSDVKLMDDGTLVFRGARKGDMIYYVDGIKVEGSLNLPSSAISNMMVYSGGLPAQFGDTMGGVVAVESKGYFELLRNYESAQLRMGK